MYLISTLSHSCFMNVCVNIFSLLMLILRPVPSVSSVLTGWERERLSVRNAPVFCEFDTRMNQFCPGYLRVAPMLRSPQQTRQKTVIT